jgi:hypothetical protein
MPALRGHSLIPVTLSTDMGFPNIGPMFSVSSREVEYLRGGKRRPTQSSDLPFLPFRSGDVRRSRRFPAHPRHSSHPIPLIPFWRGFLNKDFSDFSAPPCSFVCFVVSRLCCFLPSDLARLITPPPILFFSASLRLRGEGLGLALPAILAILAISFLIRDHQR